MHFIIDADSIAYRAAASAEQRLWRVRVKGETKATLNYKVEAEEWAATMLDNPEEAELVLDKEPEPVENALHNTDTLITNLTKQFDCSTYVLYLTGTKNYRDKIATLQKYKGNRDGLEKPVHLKACRDRLISQWGAITVDGYEADDACSIEQWQHISMSDLGLECDSVIASIDKDLNCVPGNHYDWVKDERYFMSEIEAYRFFCKQLLTGDSTDNIIGCGEKQQSVYKSGKKKGQEYEKRVGVGPKEADEILKDVSNKEELLCKVAVQYIIRFDNWYERLLENGRLLWMQQIKGELWEPNFREEIREEVLSKA